MDRDAVTRVRSFNRTVAERIGALTDEFLGRRRPMGNSRTLWEIGPEGVEMRTLRARLGLDSGYASRVLQSLQRERLITITPSPEDGRVRLGKLTAHGQAERAQPDRPPEGGASRLPEPPTDPPPVALVSPAAH